MKPYGIATDNRGWILVSYGSNDYIHILDQDGEFLRYINNCGFTLSMGSMCGQQGHPCCGWGPYREIENNSILIDEIDTLPGMMNIWYFFLNKETRKYEIFKRRFIFRRSISKISNLEVNTSFKSFASIKNDCENTCFCDLQCFHSAVSNEKWMKGN